MLLPCPFCGSNAVLSDLGTEDDMTNVGAWWLAGCEECGIWLPNEGFNPTKEQATAAWNNREPAPAKEKEE